MSGFFLITSFSFSISVIVSIRKSKLGTSKLLVICKTGVISVVLHRTIYWAEAGVIRYSSDDGSDIRVLATGLGNITGIDISDGKFNVVFVVNCFAGSANAMSKVKIWISIA